MSRLDLIQFSSLNGRPSEVYGLQEVGAGGEVVGFYDDEANLFLCPPVATWRVVRTLGTMESTGDFWRLVDDCQELFPEAP